MELGTYDLVGSISNIIWLSHQQNLPVTKYFEGYLYLYHFELDMVLQVEQV